MPTATITFAVHLDGTPEEPIELVGYLFDGRDKLIASTPVHDGQVAFALEPERLVRARAALHRAQERQPSRCTDG